MKSDEEILMDILDEDPSFFDSIKLDPLNIPKEMLVVMNEEEFELFNSGKTAAQILEDRK